MTEEILAAGEDAGESERNNALGLPDPEAGALTAVTDLALFLSGPESDGITGKLISALHDPWRTKAFRDMLRAGDDLGTMRRIDRRYHPYP